MVRLRITILAKNSVVCRMAIPTIVRSIVRLACSCLLVFTVTITEVSAKPSQDAGGDSLEGDLQDSLQDSLENSLEASFDDNTYNTYNTSSHNADNPIDKFVDFYSSMTIDEMRDKSLKLMAAGQYADAVDAIQQLQGAIHRLYGVDTIEQSESLVWLIESYGKLNRYDLVDQQQNFLFSLAVSSFDEQDSRFQYARLRLANWYLRSLRYRPALRLYDVVREWTEKNLPAYADEQPAILLLSLRGEALTRYVSGMCCASKPLLRVHEIISESDDFDFEDKQKALQNYANILLLERSPVEAIPLLQALAKASDVVSPILLGFSRPIDMEASIKRFEHRSPDWVKAYNVSDHSQGMVFKQAPLFPVVMGDPLPVCGKHLRELLKGRNRRRLAELYVDVSMSIDKKGRGTDVKMAGNTNAKIRRYLAHAIRKSRFRPGMLATGELDLTRFEFRQVFTAPTPSLAPDVSSWNGVLAAHTCQLTSL
jgi:hypothetical protein